MFYTARHSKYYEKVLNASEHRSVFWDKEKFNDRFSKYIKRDYIYVPLATEESFDEFVSSHGKLLIKPTGGSSGKGIRLYQNESYSQLRSECVLLEEFIVQHHAIGEINNHSSVNTIRVYTILDNSSIPHILSASIRVGGVNSVVDNFHSGGVVYPIDVESGVVCAPGSNVTGSRFLFHPQSNFKVIGFEIPNWNGLKEFVCQACLEIQQARLIAWDVAVLQEGFELVEGNYDGDPGVMQTPSKRGKLYEIRKYSGLKR